MDVDHSKRMVAVRFFPRLILLVLYFYGVSAFGEEIPVDNGSIDRSRGFVDNVATPVDIGFFDKSPGFVDNAAIPVDNGFIDRSHEFVAVETYKAISWLSLIHISEPTRLGMISYAVFCL